MQTTRQIVGLAILIMILSACAQPGNQHTAGEPDIIATTALIADVANHVAADRLQVVALMKPGQDAHTFEPTPADAARLEQANLVFANGLGFEESLAPLLDNLVAGGKIRIVYVSDGVDVLAGGHHHEGSEDEPEHVVGDPHTWMDPNNVKIWADNIAVALAGIDPADADLFQANADAYKAQLAELDTFIAGQVDAIPQADRKLVTDHEALGYFAHRYGFEAVGAVIPNLSTSAEPSAADLAALVTVMREQDVKAIFVETSVSDVMAKQVAAEVGYPVQILRLYYTLGAPGSGADTYLSMMRVNIGTIVKGLTNN
jgi:ABC-type Zn uptake system ZnuABC Zn-binding protein ZnuA